ncbi:DNA-binding protein WhiA [Alkalithermobacter paradoxus]|uniref:Probable cell division protein WhiA n=1 Tax=Alkalithermobacter paradoxus TaxID=29349 RepID=A0A1V4I5U0_9FIRM|nr:sporulation transcription regulator WhiA [[Clostridium] thermoalcaliphilum]
MSFSTQTKNELSRVTSSRRCCEIAQLSAMIRTSGTIQLAGFEKLNLKISTENASIARRLFKLLKNCFNIHTEIMVRKNSNLKKNNNYILVVSSSMGASNVLKEIGVLKQKDNLSINSKIPKHLFLDDQCKRAYVRGAFLGCGSISDPEKTYHMEFVTNNSEFSEELKNLINELGFNSKIVNRKNSYVIYLKESEQISDLLNLMGAHTALLNLENVKILKEMRNNVNRIVNCETANLSKTINAAVRQMENIKYIKDTVGLDYLPENLIEIAKIRLEYEDMSLKELGEMLYPPIGKSGVNHRLRKIDRIAEELKMEKGG